jgi:hypothetical protein
LTAPGPDDASILGKLLAGTGAALAALGAWAWRHTHSRIDRVDTSKADKEAFDRLAERVENHSISTKLFDEHVKSDERQLAAINTEIGVQRANIAKIFDKLETVREDMHRQHDETRQIVLEAIRRK